MVGGVMLTAILAAPGQDTPPKPAPTNTALVTTYADGTSSYDLVSERFAWRWAPKFPLIDGARVPTGVPSALKLAAARWGRREGHGLALIFPPRSEAA